MRADGGRRAGAVHDGLDSTAARCLLAAACVRALLDGERRTAGAR
jgi:hypothetical protein